MSKKNAISMKMVNNLLIVDCSNLSGKLLCERVLERAVWTDILEKGKYRILDFDEMYKLITQINKYNAKTDTLFARARLLSDSTLF